MCTATLLEIVPDYEGYSRLLKLLNDENVATVDTKFGNYVNVEVAVKDDYLQIFKKKLLDAFNGKIDFVERSVNYYDFG